MGGHPEHSRARGAERRVAWGVAGAGLAGACAAMAIPGYHADIAEVSAILAVGALALLAGHRWGLLIVAAADLLLLGYVWPVLAFGDRPESWARLAAGTAVLGALPGLLVFSRTLPHTLDLLAGRRLERLRPAGAALGSLAALLWLSAPAISHLRTPTAQAPAIAATSPAPAASPPAAAPPVTTASAPPAPTQPAPSAADLGAAETVAASVVEGPAEAAPMPADDRLLEDDATDADAEEDDDLWLDAVSGADPALPDDL
jgi:hypothetical protein